MLLMYFSIYLSVCFFSKSTLFISECVLVYMRKEAADDIIKWSATFPRSIFILYEMILPHDRFGQTMIENLEARGSPLLTVKDYPTLESQKQRFEALGYSEVESVNMLKVHTYLDPKENARIQQIEALDELEEWQLIQSHYCFICAKRDQSKEGTLLKCKLKNIKEHYPWKKEKEKTIKK